MKRIFTLCSLAALLTLVGCSEKKTKATVMEIDNTLTAEERSAGILTPEVMWKMARLGGSVLSPDGKTVLYTLTKYNMEENRRQTTIWSLGTDGKNPVRITDGAGNESSVSWSADGRTVYFISSRNDSPQLWSANPDGTDTRQISNIEDGIEGYGVAPTGDKVFYIQRVPVEQVRSAEIHPDLSESQARIYDGLMVRHWDRWQDGSYLHIFVGDLRSGSIVDARDIMPNEPWDAPLSPYFDAGEISWNHAGTQLAYTCKKKSGTEYAISTDSDVFLYDLASQTTRNLTESLMGYDKYPVFSPDDKQIAFLSMARAGNESDKNRLFLVDLASGQYTYLTADFDFNADNVVWDGNEAVYFLSPIEATHQLCRVSTDGKEPVKVVTSGLHDINRIAFSGGRMVGERTTLSSATELFDIDPVGGALTQITWVNKPIYDHVKMGEVRKYWIKTTDGKQMLTWVVLPPDFDPNKKYPALLYCQGGPQSVVSQFWSYRWNFQLMAAQGYIVVAPNRRGLPSFGQQWLDQISGDYSGQNIRDYLSAIDEVSKEPWVDRDRLGCVGASYGGYSAFFLAGNHQKRFKAFIAHCGMFNLESQYGSTEELWFPNNDLGGPYWSDNPVAKRSYANSPHRFVRNWDTPILIFSGQNDFRIPYTESLQAFTAAQLMGVPSRLVTFENEAHQVFKPQNSLVWNREFFAWLDKYVKNAGINAPSGEVK